MRKHKLSFLAVDVDGVAAASRLTSVMTMVDSYSHRGPLPIIAQRSNMKRSPHLATRIWNTPLLIHPAKASAILYGLRERLGIDAGMFDSPPEAPDTEDDNDTPGMADGLCVIPVYGTLVKRSTGMDAMSGLTSYGDIRECVEDAMEDPECKGLVFDFDSPGGEVSGMFELCEFLTSLRGQKPMYGVANDAAYSAAYALASCMDRLYVTSTGGVGSIGCYCLYVDQSEYDKKQGVKYNFIFAGDRKIDGNPHAPLSDEARAAAQAEVDRIRDMFITLVAKNRNVGAQALIDTQAGCYFGAQAIPLLADKIGGLNDALNDMAALLQIERTAKLPTAASVPLLSITLGQGGELDHWTAARSDIATLALIATRPHSLGWADLESGPGLPVLALRTARAQLASPNSTSAREISCLVVPYGQLSDDLGSFKEIYEPGCFAESLASQDDFRALNNHDTAYVLGRRSAGTARFFEQGGVCFTAQAPQTQWADDLLVSMRRGDITQSSAAFYILKSRWIYEGSQKIRVIERAQLVEASVMSLVAYQSTTASVVEQQAIAAQHQQYGARLRLLSL